MSDAPRWTFKVEYLFVDLGSATNGYAFAPLPTINNATLVNFSVARAGVNFRF